jgi:hypothetical protein
MRPYQSKRNPQALLEGMQRAVIDFLRKRQEMDGWAPMNG